MSRPRESIPQSPQKSGEAPIQDRPGSRSRFLVNLSVESLRNLESFSLELSPGLNVFSGQNAQGKSNALEAIGLICQARSFRNSSNEEILCFGEPHGAVQAAISEGTVSEPSWNARLALDKRHKYAFLDRQRVTRLEDYLLQTPPIVTFQSSSLEIGRGSPEARRRFLDELLVGADPVWLQVLRRYRRALSQRNSAIKRGWTGPELEGFENELAETGVRILLRRRKLVEALQKKASSFQNEFQELLELEYSCSLPLDFEETNLEHLQSQYLKRLHKEREQDFRRGFTRKGPHRDDVLVELNGRALRKFGSQGQVRSVVLSLKLAELQLLERYRGIRPLLLLDDVGAELDEARRAKLFAVVSRDYQAFLSTTEVSELGLTPGRFQHFRVRQGSIESVD